ncbi:MAG: hypothetical protein SFZ24_12730 [Planctomycetota bacterium]|nr:hypothetical protein [Planctomycetota bacterium]
MGPATPPAAGTLPTTLTFFLTVDERREVLRALRRVGRDRARALLRALRIA